MTQIALQPEEIERARSGRARQLALFDIPFMRVIGSLFLVTGVYLNNRFLAEPGVPLRPWWMVAIALAVYAVFSWAVARVVLLRTSFDLTMYFLFGDIILWCFAIYATGAERSWIFFIPVLRVADQMQTTVRRCGAFTLSTLQFGCTFPMGCSVSLVPESRRRSGNPGGIADFCRSLMRCTSSGMSACSRSVRR